MMRNIFTGWNTSYRLPRLPLLLLLCGIQLSNALPHHVKSQLREASIDRNHSLFMTYSAVIVASGPLVGLAIVTCFCWFRSAELVDYAARGAFDLDWRERRLLLLQTVNGVADFQNAAYASRDPRAYLVNNHYAELLRTLYFERMQRQNMGLEEYYYMDEEGLADGMGDEEGWMEAEGAVEEVSDYEQPSQQSPTDGTSAL